MRTEDTKPRELGPRQQSLVDALRSGKYAQTQQVLHDRTGFCCLGVACDISGLGKWTNSPESVAATWYLGNTFALPEEVREYFGFRSVKGSYGKSCLASDNDNGASFVMIAEIIEAEAAYLFEEPK